MQVFQIVPRLQSTNAAHGDTLRQWRPSWCRRRELRAATIERHTPGVARTRAALTRNGLIKISTPAKQFLHACECFSGSGFSYPTITHAELLLLERLKYDARFDRLDFFQLAVVRQFIGRAQSFKYTGNVGTEAAARCYNKALAFDG